MADKAKVVKNRQKRVSPRLIGTLLFISLGLLLGVIISFTTVVAVKHTSDVNFCGSCHSMKPMANAYRNSVHGGYGDSGVMATCADCHLPHKSTIGYMIQKVRTGMWDVWVESTHDTSKIDWHERRLERHKWVYDSGCLHCHENLLQGTKANKKAYLMHKAYFAKKLMVERDGVKESAKCVDCHKHVGHYELEKHLPLPISDELSSHKGALGE